MKSILRITSFLLLQVIVCNILAQQLVYRKDYPMSNVKNLVIAMNDKKITLVQTFNNGKMSYELTDSTFKKIRSGTEEFDFITWEYLTTFKSNDGFTSLYRDGQNLALGIISINGATPYRFLKIGNMFNNPGESFFGYKNIKDKAYIFSISRKESKFGVTIVSQKGIVSRTMYDAPIKLSKNFDNTEFDFNKATNPITFNSVENDLLQNISLTKGRSKSFYVDGKLYFCFRGKSEKDDSACLKFLIFNTGTNSFSYKELANTVISQSPTGIDNINYTMLDNKLYFVHLTTGDFSVVVLDASNFSELFRYSTLSAGENKFPVKKLYIDGDNNITGNDYYSTDTIIPDKYEFLSTILNKQKRLATSEYTVAIAANKMAGNIILSVGSTRTTYFRSNYQLFGDMFNAPMGSTYTVTNNNYNHLLLPYFSKNKGENFQTIQFNLKLDAENKICESEKSDNLNTAIRTCLKNILKKGITIKDILLYDFNNEWFFSVINSKDNKVEIYKLDISANGE